MSVYQFQWEQVQQLAQLVERTLSASLTITDNNVHFSVDNAASDSNGCDLQYQTLQEKSR